MRTIRNAEDYRRAIADYVALVEADAQDHGLARLGSAIAAYLVDGGRARHALVRAGAEAPWASR